MVLAAVAAAPVLAQPSLRAEQVTQLVLGEGATVMDARDGFQRVRTTLDGVEGWIHAGYLLAVDRNRHDAWLATAGWSEGALLGVGSSLVRAPHRARLQVEGEGGVRLPDGRAARIEAGAVRPMAEVLLEAHAVSPADWAWREFAETPYLWGGVTAAGIDCSGLVQITYLTRGVALPRDAHQQAEHGTAVATDEIRPGDLLCFRGPGAERIDHVGIAAAGGELVHATLSLGRVVREPWGAGSRLAGLGVGLLATRRLT